MDTNHWLVTSLVTRLVVLQCRSPVPKKRAGAHVIGVTAVRGVFGVGLVVAIPYPCSHVSNTTCLCVLCSLKSLACTLILPPHAIIPNEVVDEVKGLLTKTRHQFSGRPSFRSPSFSTTKRTPVSASSCLSSFSSLYDAHGRVSVLV